MDKRIFKTREELLKCLTEEVVNAHLNSDMLLWDQVADADDVEDILKRSAEIEADLKKREIDLDEYLDKDIDDDDWDHIKSELREIYFDWTFISVHYTWND